MSKVTSQKDLTNKVMQLIGAVEPEKPKLPQTLAFLGKAAAGNKTPATPQPPPITP